MNTNMNIMNANMNTMNANMNINMNMKMTFKHHLNMKNRKINYTHKIILDYETTGLGRILGSCNFLL